MAESTAQPHPLVERFPMDAASTEPHEVERYFQNRAVQLLSSGWKFTGKYERLEWGAITSAVHEGDPSKVYHTAYIYADKRAQGVFTSWIKSHPDYMIVTTPDCSLEAFLTKHSIPYAVAHKPQFEEYAMVEAFYGNKVTRRSGVHLINHIDEGLYILKRIGASEWAQRAYAIHPILQGDDELAAFWSSDKVEKLDQRVMLLGVEYRSTANNYLSFKSATEPIKLSPITDVNHMLVADKVQNRKDFEIYHKGTHPRSDRLDEYFRQWLGVLGVSEEQYQALRLEILERTTLPTPISEAPPYFSMKAQANDCPCPGVTVAQMLGNE